MRDSYWKVIEKALNDLFLDLLYKPLVKAAEIQNASSNPVVTAIRKRRIKYKDKEFVGEFNAEISAKLRAMGAKYNARKKTWQLEDVSAEIQLAQAQADAKEAILRETLLKTLDDLPKNFAEKYAKLNISGKYTWALRYMNKDFLQAVKSVTVAPKLSQHTEEAIAQAYDKNLELFVRNFTEENTAKLRQLVRESAFAGGRAESLSDIIQKNFKVTKNKAKFLARQETSLLLSKFHEQRYKDVGISKYRWSTSHDQRVRHDHKELDGKTCYFDLPPIVDRSTGKRANPGEDYNCRCIAIPIWE